LVSVFAVVVAEPVPVVEVVAVEPAVLVSVVVDVVAVVPVADVSVDCVIVPVVAVLAVSVEVVPVVLELLTAVSVVAVAAVSFAGSSFLQPTAKNVIASRASRVARVVFFMCTVLLNFPDLAICFFRTV
jgi:hypothetical protein